MKLNAFSDYINQIDIMDVFLATDRIDYRQIDATLTTTLPIRKIRETSRTGLLCINRNFPVDSD